jgi:hypothetical protein
MFEKLLIPVSIAAILVLGLSGLSSFMGVNPLDQSVPESYKNSNWKNLDTLDNSQIQDISKIEVSGGVQVNVSKADVAYLSKEINKDSLKYLIQDNILLISYQPKSRLKISTHKIYENNILNVGLKSVESLSVMGVGVINSSSLVTDKLDLKIDGSGTINMNKVDLGELTTVINGSGKVNIDGNSNQANTQIDGAGQLNGQDLKSKIHTAFIKGIGQIRVDSEKINVKIVGNGSLEYRNTPIIEKDIKGTGRVYRYNETT